MATMFDIEGSSVAVKRYWIYFARKLHNPIVLLEPVTHRMYESTERAFICKIEFEVCNCQERGEVIL